MQIGAARLELVQGNIVDQDVDAVVNAANRCLFWGLGVTGAIYRAAGPRLLFACLRLRGCAPGNAKITAGYGLKARQIIHAVGPVYRAQPEDAHLLASAYRRSLDVAAAHGVRSIAFPALSTGIYGYPLAQAAPIALQTVTTYLREHAHFALVRFVLWDTTTLTAFRTALPHVEGVPQ